MARQFEAARAGLDRKGQVWVQFLNGSDAATASYAPVPPTSLCLGSRHDGTYYRNSAVNVDSSGDNDADINPNGYTLARPCSGVEYLDPLAS